MAGGTRLMAAIALAVLLACRMAAQQTPAPAGVVPGVVPGVAAAVAIPNAPPSVSFRFERPGLLVPRYTLVLGENGEGHYRGEEGLPARTSNSVPQARSFTEVFSISKSTSSRVFALSEKLKRFHVTCASNAKNIADTGQKTLEYSAADGAGGSCVYNYSENKDVQVLTQIFEGIASTLDQGRRLDFLHRYDRLGLDDAIKTLAEEVSGGQALELGTIAPSLRSIADDADVMRRVRLEASTLLAQIPAQTCGAASVEPQSHLP